jgi:hypothetical protein
MLLELRGCDGDIGVFKPSPDKSVRVYVRVGWACTGEDARGPH